MINNFVSNRIRKIKFQYKDVHKYQFNLVFNSQGSQFENLLEP